MKRTPTDTLALVDQLADHHSLPLEGYQQLVEDTSDLTASSLAKLADQVRRPIYGNKVYIRGLIELSSICSRNCLYCGIRRGNPNAERYRLTPEEILTCAEEGHALGFRTFVLQGGEDPWFTDERLEDLLHTLKRRFPDCAVTLSLGERSRESYQRLFDAGADRYLLRHETADPALYAKLHPPEMSWENRMQCLRDLKDIGYQVGCGFMVGAPYQSARQLAMDLKFVEQFHPDMCGIGPFVPHHDTVFRDQPAGGAALTVKLLSILRLIHPKMLLPATTALGTIDPHGREKGILAGANVVMPNLSPVGVRRKYSLYDNKICTGDESAQCRACLEARLRTIGFETVVDRGDVAK